jgi:hypothetical protein
MIHNLEELVNKLYQNPSDINEHIPTLIKYGQECEHITEMGVRGICSTWAFLASSPQKLISYDLEDPSNWGGKIQDVYDTAKHYELDFSFIKGNVLDIEIEPTDFLFLDTWHVYEQVRDELKLHSPKVKKYIGFHDIVSWGEKGETPGYKGINYAIDEFLTNSKEWVIKEKFLNNNGLLIIERTNVNNI